MNSDEQPAAAADSPAGGGLNGQSESPPGDRLFGVRFMSAIAWTGGAKWAAQIISWPTTVIVARILSPSDYGLVGMATLVMTALSLGAGLGIGTTVVTQSIQSRSVLTQLNGAAFLLGLAAFAIVTISAERLAWFFSASQLVSVVVVLGALFVVDSAKTVAEAVLVRERRFRLLAGIETGRAVTVAAVTLACAVTGWGYWSLVAGYVASAVFGTTATLFLKRVAFERPTLHVVGPIMRLSLHVVGAQLAWYAYSNCDFLIAGRVLGSSSLGIYTMAWTIANAPVDKIAATLNRVSESFFAANRGDMAVLRSQFLRMTEGITIVTMPACIGLATVSDDLVLALLGPKWSAVALPLTILCIYNLFRCIAVVQQPLLLVLGESRHVLLCTITAAIGLPVCFLIGSRAGPAGIAVAWVLAYPIVALSLHSRLAPRLGLPLAEYLGVLRVSIGPTVLMALGLLVLRALLSDEWQPVSRLATQVLIGGMIWLGALLTLSRQKAVGLFGLARQVAGGGADQHP